MSARGGRFAGVLMTLALVGMGLFYLAFVLDEGRMFNGPLPALALAAGAAILAAVFLGPVGRAIVRMLEGAALPQHDDETQLRLEDLEARQAELSLEQRRVAELEERLDFAERLLAQRNESELPRLGGGDQ